VSFSTFFGDYKVHRPANKSNELPRFLFQVNLNHLTSSLVRNLPHWGKRGTHTSPKCTSNPTHRRLWYRPNFRASNNRALPWAWVDRVHRSKFHQLLHQIILDHPPPPYTVLLGPRGAREIRRHTTTNSKLHHGSQKVSLSISYQSMYVCQSKAFIWGLTWQKSVRCLANVSLR
jgi:hypothetical protein